MLYGGEEVRGWRDSGAGGAVPGKLAQDLDGGRRLFNLRVPDEIARERDFINEALRQLLARAGGAS